MGVMGSGTHPHGSRATPLGRWLASAGVHLLNGGGSGVMASVSAAFASVHPREGLIVGVLPGSEEQGQAPPGYPNPWVELAIRTHLPLRGSRGGEPLSRNHVNVLTADVIVALPGGAGTLSEVELALRYGRPVMAFVAAPTEIPGLPGAVPWSGALEEVTAFVREHTAVFP